MPTTEFSHGVQFGGRNGFKVLHGGQIRANFPVEATTTFLEGSALELNSDGTVQLSTAQITKLTGITDTRREVVDGIFVDQTIGSGRAAVILDPAVLVTEELTSGAVFLVNDQVFQDEAGSWTNTQPATDTRVYGVALVDAVANAGDALRWFYFRAQR